MAKCNLEDVMRAIGGLEGKVDGINQRLDRVNGRLDKHDDKIEALDTFKDTTVGKQTVLAGVTGLIFGLIGAWISRGSTLL